MLVGTFIRSVTHLVKVGCSGKQEAFLSGAILTMLCQGVGGWA